MDLFGMVVTLAMLLLAVFLIDRLAVSRFAHGNARKVIFVLLAIAALFAFNYLRIAYGLRTVLWAESLNHIVLENISLYNLAGVFALALIALLVWLGLTSRRKTK